MKIRPAPFLSTAYRRQTFFSRVRAFPFATDLFGSESEGSEGRQDQQGGLNSPNSDQRIRHPRPPAVMTSPHPIHTRQLIDEKQEEEVVTPRAFWKKKKLSKALKLALQQAGISIDEFLSLQQERASLTLHDMSLRAYARRSLPLFAVRTPGKGIALIAGDRIIYFPPGHRFNLMEQCEQDLGFLMPYLAQFQLVDTKGPSVLQKLFHRVLVGFNQRNEVDIAHKPNYQPNDNAALANRLNAEMKSAPQNKWQRIAFVNGVTSNPKPSYRNPPLPQAVPQNAPTPQNQPRLTPRPFHPVPRPR